MEKTAKLFLPVAIMMAASMWFYVQRVLIPYQKADAALHSRPRGILSDLYPRWLGTQELLINHKDPYGQEVTREIQTGYYGRVLDPQRPGDPKDEQRFAYPVYVAFLLAPTIHIPFPMVRSAFAWMLGIVTGISVPLWMRGLRWRGPALVCATVVVLTLGSFGALQGIKLQQLSLLVAGLIAGSAALLAGGQFFLAGILLAVATIKPQLVVLAAVWLVLWTVNNWRERHNFLWGFLLTSVVLMAGGEYLLPHWISRFVEGLAAYNRYTGGRSLLDNLVGSAAGMILAVLFLLSAAIVCWRLRSAPAGSGNFNLALALILTITVVVAPMVAPYNHLLLLPAVLLIVRSWSSLWRRGPASRILCSSAVLIFFWPWLASMGLVVASAVLPVASVQRAWAVPLWSSLEIPLAVLGLLILCIIDSPGRQPSALAQRA